MPRQEKAQGIAQGLLLMRRAHKPKMITGTTFQILQLDWKEDLKGNDIIVNNQIQMNKRKKAN